MNDEDARDGLADPSGFDPSIEKNRKILT